MTLNFEESLDSALDRMQNGEPITAVLQAYPEQAKDLAPLLQSANLLSQCEPVVLPSPEETLADQQQFINQMAQLLPPAVSPSPAMRLNRWMVLILSWLGLNPNRAKRERKNMGTLLLKAALVFTILFGAVGGTAVMAAESLPDSPLYPAKMIIEQARLNLAADDVAQADIHIQLAGERLRELERLMVDGNMPDDALLVRAENHVEAAFGLAAEMPTPQMAGILAQAQTMLQTRTRAFTNIERQIPVQSEPVFNQAQLMLRNAGETAAAGLQEPQLWRHRDTVNRPETAPTQPERLPHPVIIITPTQPITTPVRIGPAGPCAANETCDPQGEGPYGPAYNGPNDAPNGPNQEPPGPGAPGGVGPGEPNPDPGPADPPGNPDPGCEECDNENGNQYGPQPEDSGNGSGQPGGSEEGIPIGGQMQSGAQSQTPGNMAGKN